MADRTLMVQGLVTNGVSVGGLAAIGFTPRYQDVSASRSDGAVGSENVDRGGLMCEVSMQCGDVKQGAAILAGTPGDTSFASKEAATVPATFQTTTIDATSDGAIIWHGMNLVLGKLVTATTLSLNGTVRFASGSKLLSDILALVAAQEAPSLTYPSRLLRAHNFSFAPAVGSAISLVNLEMVGLNLAVEEMHTAYGDDDVAMSDVDRGNWGPLGVTAEHGDAGVASASTKNAQLLAAGVGVLTVDVMGAAGGDEQVLTVNNLLWGGAPHNFQASYTAHQLAGSCGWRSGETNYNLLTATGPPAYTALWGFAAK